METFPRVSVNFKSCFVVQILKFKSVKSSLMYRKVLGITYCILKVSGLG